MTSPGYRRSRRSLPAAIQAAAAISEYRAMSTSRAACSSNAARANRAGDQNINVRIQVKFDEKTVYRPLTIGSMSS